MDKYEECGLCGVPLECETEVQYCTSCEISMFKEILTEAEATSAN
jgi:hypothetical protein